MVFVFFNEEQAAFFADHHGVLTRREALDELGLSRGQLERLVSGGALVRVHPSTYRLAVAPATWESKLRAAVLSVNGLASHEAAARLWQIDGFMRRPIEVTMWESKRVRREGVIVHVSRQMHLADTVVINGIPTTGVARTVLDLFGVLWPNRQEQLLDAVLRQELVDLTDLHEVVVRHSVQGRNGVGILRRVLECTYDPSAVPDSRWNRMVGQLLKDHGITGVVYEHTVADNGGAFIGRIDLALPDLMIGIELDSVRWHMDRTSFAKDPRRRNRLQLQGWTILNFTWADYSEQPEQLVRTVQSAISTARRNSA